MKRICCNRQIRFDFSDRNYNPCAVFVFFCKILTKGGKSHAGEGSDWDAGFAIAPERREKTAGICHRAISLWENNSESGAIQRKPQPQDLKAYRRQYAEICLFFFELEPITWGRFIRQLCGGWSPGYFCRDSHAILVAPGISALLRRNTTEFFRAFRRLPWYSQPIDPQAAVL